MNNFYFIPRRKYISGYFDFELIQLLKLRISHDTKQVAITGPPSENLKKISQNHKFFKT